MTLENCCNSLDICVGALATSLISLIGVVIFYIKSSTKHKELQEQIKSLKECVKS